MKTKILALTSILLASGISAHAADYTYYWDPNLEGYINNNPAQTGGDGSWGNDYKWWDYGSNSTVSVDTSFGHNATTPHNLYFTGSSNITKSRTATFVGGGGPNHVYYNFLFEAGSTTNLSAADDLTTAGFNFGNSTGTFNVGAGGILNIGGGSGKPIYLSSAKNVSNGDGIVFMGAGTINLGQGAIIRTAHGNSRILVNGGATVNFNAGSAIYAKNGDAANPFATSEASRLMVHNGVLNINGGNLYLGYRADMAVDNGQAKSYGLAIGQNTGGSGTSTSGANDVNATVNIHAGNVYALGDPRSDTTNAAGVSFGWNSQGGGTLNLFGGNLITNNIRTTNAVGKANLNLDGGTIIVSTDFVASTNGSMADASDTNLQTRLNTFIMGFGSATHNSIVIGNNGVTFDTTQIDVTKTNGTATVRSPFHGTGDLVVKGATKGTVNTTLLLQLDANVGDHSYTGNTVIDGGTLALGSRGNGITSSREILIKTQSVFDVSRRSTTGYTLGAGQLLRNEGTGKVLGNIKVGSGTIQARGTFLFDGSLESDSGSTFKFDNLGTDIITAQSLNLGSDTTLDLSDATLSLGSTYDLFLAESISFGSIHVFGQDAYDFLFDSVDIGGGQYALRMEVIPEPSTYALIAAMIVFGVTFLRRRRG